MKKLIPLLFCAACLNFPLCAQEAAALPPGMITLTKGVSVTVFDYHKKNRPLNPPAKSIFMDSTAPLGAQTYACFKKKGWAVFEIMPNEASFEYALYEFWNTESQTLKMSTRRRGNFVLKSAIVAQAGPGKSRQKGVMSVIDVASRQLVVMLEYELNTPADAVLEELAKQLEARITVK